MKHLTLRALVVVALAAAMLAPAGPAGADLQHDRPVDNGCPARQLVLSVADLAEQGYAVPVLVDQTGNGNGWVCALPLPEASRDARFPATPLDLYLFSDDSIPAQR